MPNLDYSALAAKQRGVLSHRPDPTGVVAEGAADLMDVAYNVKEADYALKHLDNWMKPERVHTPLVFEPGHVRVRRDPLGLT